MEQETPATARPQATRTVAGRLGAYAVAGAITAGMIALLLALKGGAQGTLAQAAGLLPFGYAFAAGMVASVNPCGFLLLPSYLSYHLGIEEKGFFTSPVYVRGYRAMSLGLAATAGFVVVFSLVGAVIALGGRWLVSLFPFAGLGIGVALASLGAWLLITGRSLGIASASRISVAPRKNLANVFLFGIAYAICSLSCTLPVFLVVVGSALATRGAADSFAQFISYSLGMGAVLVSITMVAALFRGAASRPLRWLMPHVHVISAMFLTGAGAYIIFYWIRYGDLFS